MIPPLPGVTLLHTETPDVQSVHASAFPIVEFSEPPTETPLDLNFSQKGSQSTLRVQSEAESLLLKEPEASPSFKQQEVVPQIVVADGATPSGGGSGGFDSPPSKTRGGGSTTRSTTSQKSRCHWTHGEIIALFDAKKAQAERAELGLRKLRSSASGKWDEIADCCKTLGVNKMASQCRDKWERLWPAFRKILDWEKQPPEGKTSYWMMTEDEREREGFPRLFDKELYDAMSARFGFVTSLNLSSLMHIDQFANGHGRDGDPAILGEAATNACNEPGQNASVEALADAGNEPAQNGTAVLEDAPAVVDNHAPRSSGRKRKTPERFGSAKQLPAESNKRVTILLEAKEEDVGNVARPSKDLQSNKTKPPLDLAERRLLLEERKLKLAERRFSLEERKLEATIEIGKGLIASMERMTGTISSLGFLSAPQQQ